MARQLCVGGFGAAAKVAAKMLDGDERAEGAEGEDRDGPGPSGEATGGLDDDGSSFTSYANTLNSLLGVLEPGRIGQDEEDEQDGSGAEAPERARPLIIILDEFDLFADRVRQSFLYTLLDIVQGNRRKGGMAVIGLSSAVVSCLSLLSSVSSPKLTTRDRDRTVSINSRSASSLDVRAVSTTSRLPAPPPKNEKKSARLYSSSILTRWLRH